MYFPAIDGKPYSLSFTTYRNGITLRGEFHYDDLRTAQNAMLKLKRNVKRNNLELKGSLIIKN